MKQHFHRIGRQLRNAARNVAAHGDVPGYEQLSPVARLRLNTMAFIGFLGSAACVHLLCALGTWLLVTYILVWTHDLRGPAAAVLPSAALLWLLPWLAAIRRRQIARLLGGRWGSSQPE